MKVKILKSKNETTWYKHFVDSEFEVGEYDRNNTRLPFKISGMGWVYESDCVITELPESFCVKSCDDGIKWGKYIQWLNKNYNTDFCGRIFNFDRPYYGVINDEGWGIKIPFGTEIHIDDIIKHIDYMESQQHINGGEQFSKESQLIAKMDKILKEEEFDLTTLEGRIYHTKKHYPIGTKYIPLNSNGVPYKFIKEINMFPKYGSSCIEGGFGFIYANGKWAEIIKEEKNMETQKLSREGLKEIYSVACDEWQGKLKSFGYRNPLENYIDLTKEEVNEMFFASNDKQKSILSKYLKQDDGSINFDNILGDGYKLNERQLIGKRTYGQYKSKSFYLDNKFDWKIQKDEYGELCLIPTKKK
jgi:hypothetical protein